MSQAANFQSPKRLHLSALVALLAISAAVAAISGLVTTQSVGDWYVGLNKPPFNPPNWVFGPVWTALYIAMAVAAWRVWCTGPRRRRGPIRLYAAQMALNFAWSLLFFGARQVGLALIDIIALLALVLATAVAFWRRDRVAGALMLPYAAWVAFATVLNAAIWRLN